MPERIQRQRTKGWRMPEGAVYVGRPGRWGNPFGFDFLDISEQVRLYGDLIAGFWNPAPLDHLTEAQYRLVYAARSLWSVKLGSGHPAEIARAELAGRDLACWCRTTSLCHADVLLEVANG